MCGGYKLKSDKQRIAEAFHIQQGLDEILLEPEENVSPGSIQPVISFNDASTRQLELMRWGFKMPDRMLFNARSEGLDRWSFWRESFAGRRCIIPADGFYEWEKVRKGRKYEFTVPGTQPFGMAGLWAPWKNPKTGEQERAFAILTTEANGTMLPIHNRQPAILYPGDYEEYLSAMPRPPLHLLRVLRDEELAAKVIKRDTLEAAQACLFDSL
jgi:putative SOS response-associated peptidase YedK